MLSISRLVEDEAAWEDVARRERMRRAWLAYHGDDLMPVSPERPEDAVRPNYARVVVEQGVSALFGRGLTVRLGRGAPAGAQEWLDRAWEANGRDTLLHRLAVNGAVCGHAFLRLCEPGPAGLGLPRLIVLDPATVTVRWRPDDWEDVVRYVVQWHGLDPDTGRAAAFRQIIERSDTAAWRVTDQRSEGDDPHWQTTATHNWPYPWPPIGHCQNLPAPNEFWGLGDLEPDVLDLCRAMSRVLSNALRILRLHAHPRLWGRGFEADDLALGVDDLTILPGHDASLNLLEMRGDLSSSMELYRRIKDALHELARVPEISSGALNALGRVSGVALRVLYQPLVEKTRTKRMLYGDLIRQTSRRMLEMGGFGPDVPVELEWPSVGPSDPYEEARTALIYARLREGTSTAASDAAAAYRKE